jgi:uracil-DNA glycosylase
MLRRHSAACAGRGAFSHDCKHEIDGLTLFSSYHCSRYNTNTGVLTPEMFREVFARPRAHLKS